MNLFNPYDNEEENKNNLKTAIMSCLCIASLIILVFLFFLYNNSKEEEAKRSREYRAKLLEEEELLKEREEAYSELEIGKSNLRSEDLDFWDMYESGSIGSLNTDKGLGDTENTAESKEEKKISFKEKDEKPLEEPVHNEEPLIVGNDEAVSENKDENKIPVVDADGKIVYYDILSDMTKNKYDLKNNLTVKNMRLSYDDGDFKSLTGVLISKADGIIEYNKMKEDSVDFVMLKVAGRSPDNGLIALDEYFVTNALGANLAGIKIGAYFTSAATSEAEAVEEANFTVGAISQYNITYPVAVYVDNGGDSSRTEKLDKDERTAYLKKYLETVKSFGYKPMVYAERNMLISGLDLLELKDYPILLADKIKLNEINSKPANERKISSVSGTSEKGPGNEPPNTSSSQNIDYRSSSSAIYSDDWYTDFPYDFAMWHYTREGSVEGMSRDADLILSMVDYGKMN
ncbi:MAG: hypothetical protein K5931_08175 [Lachnospiraceae bacterium]|nr:hypothetical protein [Lachnospiraceae bacterium]